MILGEVQIAAPDPHRVIPHTTFSSVVWGFTAIALVWRRKAPWAVFAVMVGGLTLEAVPAPDSGTFAGFVALCVAVYTVARVEDRLERTVIAAAIALLALVFHYSRDPQASNAVESIQATYVVLLACPLIARLVTARAARGAALISELAAEQGRREDAALAAAAAERARIARELHDVIAHSVNVTIVQSMAAQAAIRDGHVAIAESRLKSIEEVAREALADMRRLVAIEAPDAPVPREAQPRVLDLANLMQRLRAGGVVVELEHRGEWADVPLGADLALFRITQEALTNAITHAPGAPIQVRVTRKTGSIESLVTNGQSTRADLGPGSGRGLLGMRERADLYGGTVNTGPRPGGGFEVHAVLPVQAASG